MREAAGRVVPCCHAQRPARRRGGTSYRLGMGGLSSTPRSSGVPAARPQLSVVVEASR
ncbi:MAG: hypothetical protein QXP98_08065 [Thermoproteus sp.]